MIKKKKTDSAPEDALLQETQARLKLAMEAGSLGLWDWDVSSGKAYFDPAWERQLGYAPGETPPRFDSWKKLVHPDDLPGAMEALKDHLEGHAERYDSVFRMKHKSGIWVWIHSRGRVMERTARGEPVRVCGIHQDVSARKDAEARLAKKRLDLRERIKEMTCLAEVTRLLQTDKAPASLFPEVINCIPSGWLYPEKTRVLIVFDGVRFGDDTWEETPHRLSVPLMVKGVERGTITVGLAEDGVPKGTTPFVPEEQTLLNSIAEAVARKIEFDDANLKLDSSRRAALNMMSDAVMAKDRLELTQFALDHATDPVFWINSDTSFAYVNQAACRALGYTKEELLRLSVTDISTEFNPKRWSSAQDPSAGGRVLQIETRYRRKNGETFPVEVHMDAIIYKGTSYLIAFVRDISRRKSQQQKLEQSERMFRDIFQKHSAVKLLIDPASGRILDANDAAVTFYGWPREQMLKMSIMDINQLAPDAISARMEEAQGPDRNYFEFQHRLADGRLRDVAVFSSGIEVDGRTLLHSIVHDITESKQQEAHLRMLSAVIQQMPDIVVITGTDGTIRYVNPAFTAVTGYAAEEAIGQNPRILKSGKQNDAFYKDLWDTITAGKIWNSRLVNRRKDGSTYTESAHITPVRNNKGDIVGFSAIKEDITEELIREEQLRQSQKMEAIGQLAGGVAHDFNNLLQVISGFSTMLLTDLPPESPARPYVDEIVKASSRAAYITRQLLTFGRKEPVNIHPVNFNKVILDADQLLRLLTGEKIKLKFDLAGDLPAVAADQTQLTQVVMNLATNARDAMPDGGKLTLITGTNTVGPDGISEFPEVKPGKYICLCVCDTGCGMTPEVKARLMEPFFTTKPVGKGTGLGLPVVYGIVQQGNGWMKVESEPGEGSCFKVYLPVCEYTHNPANTQ